MINYNYHRFLDEAGDTTFYGKGKIPIIGKEGVSTHFFLGMLTLEEQAEIVRRRVIELQNQISNDSYFDSVPSIIKKKNNTGFFLHAKDDIPEVRKLAFELIKNTKCHFEVVIIKKDYRMFEEKYNKNPSNFYAELLSQLLINDALENKKLILNIAHRSKCTTHRNLENSLQKVDVLSSNMHPLRDRFCKFVFNIQKPTTEPIINITDYFLWAIQRKWERNDERYINYLASKIKKAHFHT